MKQLEQVNYFYLDEIERDIKKSAFKGGDMAKIEKLNEKELKFKHPASPTSPFEYNADGAAEGAAESSWPSALIPIELPEGINVPEIRSVEHDVQVRREQNTLAVLMFKQFLPDSPSEPDDMLEPTQAPVVKIIPLDDATLNSSLSENEVTHPDMGNNNVDMIDQVAANQNLNELNDPVGPFNNHQTLSKNKFYNPNNKKNSYESNGFGGNNNNKSNSHGYYNQQHHQHQKRQQQQQQQLKNNKPTSSNLPALANFSTNINAQHQQQQTVLSTIISPSSPPIVPLTSSLKTDIAIPINKGSADVKDPANLISISDEMTQKIKLILSQINQTSATSTDPPAQPKPVEVAAIAAEPVPEPSVEEDVNKPSSQVFNGEYKKNSKWHNNNNSNNWNSTKFNQNQNNFNSNNRKPGFYRNNNNPTTNNTNGNAGQTNGTSSSNMNNNNNNHHNNRITFQNNFRRGIGNRGGATSTHSNFRTNTNISNFNNNNNNNQYEATNPKGFGHAGAGANPNSNGTNFRKNYNNNNNNNSNNNNRGRYNQGKSYHNTDADANYENSVPKSKELSNSMVSSPTVATTAAAATTAGNSSNRGGWI